jgi:hypothetical protein
MTSGVLLHNTFGNCGHFAPTQHIELADEVAEYGGTVAGHGDNHRTASAILNAALITGGGFFRVTPTAAR